MYSLFRNFFWDLRWQESVVAKLVSHRSKNISGTFVAENVPKTLEIIFFRALFQIIPYNDCIPVTIRRTKFVYRYRRVCLKDGTLCNSRCPPFSSRSSTFSGFWFWTKSFWFYQVIRIVGTLDTNLSGTEVIIILRLLDFAK